MSYRFVKFGASKLQKITGNNENVTGQNGEGKELFLAKSVAAGQKLI
jgi:hypothetical protein